MTNIFIPETAVSYAVSADLDWDPGNSAVTIFDKYYMKSGN